MPAALAFHICFLGLASSPTAAWEGSLQAGLMIIHALSVCRRQRTHPGMRGEGEGALPQTNPSSPSDQVLSRTVRYRVLSPIDLDQTPALPSLAHSFPSEPQCPHLEGGHSHRTPLGEWWRVR